MFEGDSNWEWDKKFEEAILCDLEWSDLEATEIDENEEESEPGIDAEIEEENLPH